MKKRLFLLLLIFCISVRVVFSQSHSSKDNYTGAWETPASWDPVWTVPLTDINGIDITINGYITVNGPLSFSGSTTNLIINDTLVINGDLFLGTYNNLTVNGNGILIIRGNLTLDLFPNIITNNYIVITGYIWKLGSINSGSFVSNSNPTKVFVGAYIYPSAITGKPNFPALSCVAPTTIPYPHTNCSYGDMTDILSDPINSFFQDTCTRTNVNNNILVCAANTINLTSSSGTAYSWSGPNGFTSSLQNPSIPNAGTAMAGAYIITLITASGCADIDTINVTVNSLPFAIAGSNSPVCAGNTINLTSSGGTGYIWDGPNGFTSSVQNPSIPNADTTMSGAYKITVIAAPGCSDTDTINVTVNPLPIATSGSNSPVCAGNTINLTSSGGISYSWSGPNGFISSLQNPSIPNANPATAGAYIVTVPAATGCAVMKITNVIVNTPPIVTAGSNSPICAGNTIELTSSGGTGYNWNGPNGFTSSIQNPSIPNANMSMAGDYKVTVTVATGCTVTNTTSVIVNVLPVATAGSNSPVCEGNTINLTSSGGTTYSWGGPKDFKSSAQNPSPFNATTSMAGIYTVTVTTASGCTAAATTNLMVNALPIATAGSNSPVCVGNTINLTSSGGTSYSWGGPSGFTGSAQNPSIPDASTAIAGAYTVTVTAATGCIATNTTNVIINENPVAIAGPDQVLKFVFETEMKAELSSSETGEWSLISGSGIINDIHSPTTRVTELPGGENIFLWKVLNGNCVAETEVKINVYDPFIPSVITPNGDGRNDYFVISEIIGKVELIIFNRWGVEEYTNGNYSNDWDGRNNKGVELPNDTYFYILKFDSGKIIKGSVLIKR